MLLLEQTIVEKCFEKDAPVKQLRQSFIDILIRKYKTHLTNDLDNWVSMLINRNVKCLRRTCEIYQKWDDFDILRTAYEKFVAKDWTDCMHLAI